MDTFKINARIKIRNLKSTEILEKKVDTLVFSPEMLERVSNFFKRFLRNILDTVPAQIWTQKQPLG